MPKAVTDDARAPRLMHARRLTGLYAVTPDIKDTEDLVARVEAAMIGGARAIQYRNKIADAALSYRQAEALARVAKKHRVLFVINDNPALCNAVDADGVHVGREDGGVEAARRIVGPERIVGASCYDDFALAEGAVAAGADYVAFGSFFPSTVKPGACRADVSLLRRAAALGVPVVAIGGINAANVRELARAGAAAAAVISAVFDAVDVTAAARAIAAAFE
jgi:thiamine-phosphate pyrophosphorylase